MPTTTFENLRLYFLKMHEEAPDDEYAKLSLSLFCFILKSKPFALHPSQSNFLISFIAFTSHFSVERRSEINLIPPRLHENVWLMPCLFTPELMSMLWSGKFHFICPQLLKGAVRKVSSVKRKVKSRFMEVTLERMQESMLNLFESSFLRIFNKSRFAR